MAGRMWRWAGYVLVPGIVPLLLVYLVNAMAGDRAIRVHDVLGDGDAILIAAAWSVSALAELTEQPHGALRHFLTYLCGVLLFVGSVAYGCLTTVSVTEGEQTRMQQDIVATVTFVLLAAAAATSAWATAMGWRRRSADGASTVAS